MKKTFIIPLFVFSFIGWQNTAINKPTKANYNLKNQHVFSSLTADDRRNFLLHIDQQEISKPTGYGTNEFPSNQLNLSLTLTLINKSNDTLKYLMNYISWSDIFKADNANLHIYKAYVGTNPNPPKIEILAPHRSTTFKIPISYNKTKVNAGLSFRIGMGIFKFVSKQQLATFNPGTNFTITDTSNLVWSNTVLIPK